MAIRKLKIHKSKRILITAGPTWVAIDNVRVISNIATGQTGILLAEYLRKQGAKVSLLLGPVGACCLSKNINLLQFKFFDELKGLIKKELSTGKYDIVIHSAAVSDYRPTKVYPTKIKSGNKNWALDLTPTQKLINSIKKIDSRVFLVGFKFEPEAKTSRLISSSRKLIEASSADLVVANRIYRGQYSAYLVEKEKVSGSMSSRFSLVRKLAKRIGSYERTKDK